MVIACKVLNDSVPPVPRHLHLTSNPHLTANKRTRCADACVTDCQGNQNLRGLPIDIKSSATKAVAGDEAFRAFLHAAAEGKQQLAHLLQPVGRRCDRNKDCCHLGVRCTHTKPRSSLSAKMCHRGRLTARSMLPRERVFYTDCESIAIVR